MFRDETSVAYNKAIKSNEQLMKLHSKHFLSFKKYCMVHQNVILVDWPRD